MARVFTPVDGHTIMNLLYKQATGLDNLSVVDSSSFVSAGETVLNTGMENVLNSLSIVLNDLILGVRRYGARMRIVDVKERGQFSNVARKISFYAKYALPDGSHNTDLFTNLAAGYTSGENGGASTKSQWEQNPPMPLEMHFGGTTTWQDSVTMYEDQIKLALRNENEWLKFLDGYMTEHANDIEQRREGFYRMVLLNRMGMAYDMAADMNGSAVDLTTAFNTFYNTSYTGAQLRSTYLKEFLAFMTATIKEYSDYMEEREKTETVPGQEDALFLSLQRRRITQRAIQNLVKKYAAVAAPLKSRISPHKLRSTYATNLYNETGDIYLVADVLGHTSVDTTRKHYADMTDARRRMAAEHVHLPGDPEFNPDR